ncbi:demethylspheroidene O-methyltransferase [Rhodopseudomonas rhenobacensis]|uniref:Demethylspheroidene O-methyltransferase n=1 Tax=Rhodopseudomonas rhenobacensis TaxID=87461 RepID=A0A7W7Z883_9BRAD|nr:methyltransferase [Rhodopseudomonas rhenobacensis]MBB5049822.1 demethylspheroidene O-methyltransferase [Rhodopseudomonas rhenobacensis]
MSLRDRLLGFRDSVLSNPGFQRFAAVFPLTRPIARKRAGALFDLCAGFVYSQILLACVRLRLLDQLAGGPISAAELASRLKLPVTSMQLLLDAAIALELVQRRSQQRYGLGKLGAELYGNPSVSAMIEHHAMLYGDLQDPVALLRGQSSAGQLAGYWPYAKGGATAELSSDAVAPYTALMSASQPMITQQVLHTYSFRDHRCLLDVGGGDGAFVAAVAAQAPQLRCMLFDLPAVAAKATARFAASGLSSRATATGGSFLTDPLPQGADVISLVRVIHDHDDEAAMTLLRAVRAALPDDGTLVVAEPITGVRGTEAIGDAYFAFYLLAMGSGKPRTFVQFRQMLSDAGFAGIKLLPGAMPLVTSVITGRCAPKMC